MRCPLLPIVVAALAWAAVAASAGEPLPVTMLVPGFTVRELPVGLTNLNNVEYLPDGSLVAGGYDGRFHLLRDTDGDGLEDMVDTISPEASANYPLGVAVHDGAAHFMLTDEVIRFVDRDGDCVPETRETVARGFDDPALAGNPHLVNRRVDSTMALAFGPDGSMYLSLGHSAPSNPWWPGYTTGGRRGSLMRVRPDGTREHLASGLRYVMGLQFNRHGDLFATDQEGATWCPNGNPFDELLHLDFAGGRHYGFPPRHPQKLPDVIDEPSVFDYAPQHQSACGFRFNGPAKDRGRFGPEFWANDALVTGESRGKLWRTSVAKTAAGYVAANHQFAALGMLPVDVAVSPRGDLVVCCHSGPPDWGAGPAAPGRVFKISFTAPDALQPVAIWPASETSTVVAFDRPVDATAWRDAARLTRIEAGRAVGPADRLKTLRPGYAVVTLQDKQPRMSLPVDQLVVGSDGTTLVIGTPPRRQAVTYAVALPGGIDLAHDLSGVTAEWRGADGTAWKGWLPHPDPAAARHFLRSSPTHEPLWKHLGEPGTLALRFRFDPWQMLIPATQDGANLGWQPEPEQVSLVIAADNAVRATASGPGAGDVEQRGSREVCLTIAPTKAGEWVDLAIDVTTPATRIDVAFHTDRDSRPRALPVRRLLVPFAEPPPPIVTQRVIPEIAGADVAAGQALFAGKAACATCHQLGGQGAKVGPPLDNQRHRDYASVWRDIVDPNATLNPDAIAYRVLLADGTSATGVRLAETPDDVTLAEPGGATRMVRKTDIDELIPLSVSLMPAGIEKLLSPMEIRDLMGYLLSDR
jgi:putative heme-binding domain-containing protein